MKLIADLTDLDLLTAGHTIREIVSEELITNCDVLISFIGNMFDIVDDKKR